MKKLDVSKLMKYTNWDDEHKPLDLLAKPPVLLYHVTHIKNLDSVRKHGLVPKIGDVTRSAHGDKENPATPLVYLSDSIASGIYKHLGKNSLIITVDPKINDIWFFTGNSLVELNGNHWGKEIEEGDFPIGIEEGDFYSESKVTPQDYFDYKGNEIEMVTAKYPSNKKANNPGGDNLTFIYESGGRDPEHPFSNETLEALEEETEGESGGWEIDLRNASRREKGGYPAEEDNEWGYQKDVKCYPNYYSKKGSPRGTGYPIEKNWWQKALSFTKVVKSKYRISVRKK